MTPRLCILGLLAIPLAAQADPVSIPAGPFQMGCSTADDRCERDEGPPGGVRVEVPAFRIDRREVTVADYRACVAAGRCAEPLTHARNKYCNYDAPKNS